METPQTLGDVMRASHPAAGKWMDETKEALDDIAQSVQAHRNGKAGMMECIQDTLQKYGYKFQ